MILRKKIFRKKLETFLNKNIVENKIFQVIFLMSGGLSPPALPTVTAPPDPAYF